MCILFGGKDYGLEDQARGGFVLACKWFYRCVARIGIANALYFTFSLFELIERKKCI